MVDGPASPDDDEGVGGGVKAELYERKAHPLAAGIGRIVSCASIGAAVGVLVALFRAFAVRPLPDLDAGAVALPWAAGGALAGALSLLLVSAGSPSPWTGLRARVDGFPYARPVWTWFGLCLAFPASLAMTAGWASGALLEVQQLPATAVGTVQGGTVTTTTETRRRTGTSTSTSSRVRYVFDVAQGPRAGTYEGAGGLSGSASLGLKVPVRYDTDAPWRNRLSTRGDFACILPGSVAVAVLMAWLLLALAALPHEGGRRAEVLPFALAHALPWVAMGAFLSHALFDASA